MYTLEIPETEFFDERKSEFILVKASSIKMEHSLVSISKWESTWKKPFLSKGNKTYAETIDYFKCMTITQNVDPRVYDAITPKQIKEIENYINANFTATTFNNKNNKKSNKLITSELIYYWMTELNIPMECQKWHFSRLMTLIEVCNLEKTPKKKKRNNRDTLNRYAAINAARRQATGSKG